MTRPRPAEATVRPNPRANRVKGVLIFCVMKDTQGRRPRFLCQKMQNSDSPLHQAPGPNTDVHFFTSAQYDRLSDLTRPRKTENQSRSVSRTTRANSSGYTAPQLHGKRERCLAKRGSAHLSGWVPAKCANISSKYLSSNTCCGMPSWLCFRSSNTMYLCNKVLVSGQTRLTNRAQTLSGPNPT
jgi:hypothetical protein